MRREKKEKGAVSWENYFFLINWWESGKKLESMWAHGEVGGASLAPLFMAMLFSVRIVDLGAILAVGYFVQGNTILLVFLVDRWSALNCDSG
jgi:hypothetical protein